jgi:hypothetical protein
LLLHVLQTNKNKRNQAFDARRGVTGGGGNPQQGGGGEKKRRNKKNKPQGGGGGGGVFAFGTGQSQPFNRQNSNPNRGTSNRKVSSKAVEFFAHECARN